jgi:hypothetical protein
MSFRSQAQLQGEIVLLRDRNIEVKSPENRSNFAGHRRRTECPCMLPNVSVPFMHRATPRKGFKMAQHFHAVVSIDHKEALIFEFSQSEVTEHRIHPADRQGHVHHKAGSPGSGHAVEDKAYFSAVADALKPSHEILIVGHGTLKTEFAHFIRDHVPTLAPQILGVETLDQLTKGEIVAFARKFFEQKDRMTPQR